jgi:serine/threonine-protein kinase RsbW
MIAPSHSNTPPEGSNNNVRFVEVDIPSDVRHIERVVELVRTECQRMAYGRSQVMLNVPVALTEALSNAILRGNGEDPRKNVHVSARVDSKQLVVEVQDEGAGFDIDECCIDPTTPEQLNREDGRGLFLMRKLMDRVEHVDSAQGTLVRMTLHRA